MMIAEPFTGNLAYDVGYVLGWLLVGGNIDTVVVGALTAMLVGVYVAGRWLLRTLRR